MGIAVVVVAAVAVGIGVLARPHAAQAATRTLHVAARTTTASATLPTTQNLGDPLAGSPAAADPLGSLGGGGVGGGGVAADPDYGGYTDTGGDDLSAPEGGAPAAAPAAQAPAAAPHTAAKPTTKPAPPPTFSATTGYGCKESATLQFTQHGFYSDGESGWTRHGAGGWGTDGCNGTFDSMPMSGSSTKDDSDNWATWQFRTGAVAKGTCEVSIWVPNDSSVKDVGGNPSTYLIYTGWSASGTAPYSIQVDQTANRNHWVSTKVAIGSGALAVELLSRGIDYNGSGATYAHHAVAQVHVDCTG